MKETFEGPTPAPCGEGFCFEGAGFYVWDLDPREVRRVAVELAGGNQAPRPAQRMLVIVSPEPER